MADTKALFLSCELGLRLQAVKAVNPIMFGLINTLISKSGTLIEGERERGPRERER